MMPNIPFSTKKSLLSPRQQSIIGIAVLCITVMFVLFSGNLGLDKNEVLQLLSRFGQYVSKNATERGKTAQFQYATLDISGWGYDRVAHLSNISLNLSETTPMDTERVSFSTEQIDIRKDNSAFNSYVFELSQPVNIIRNSELTHIITGSKPIRYVVNSKNRDSTKLICYGLFLPETLRITPSVIAGEKGPAPERIELDVSSNNIINAEVNQDDGNAHVMVQMDNISVSHGTDSLVSIGSISGYVNTQNRQSGSVGGEFDLKISDIALNKNSVDKSISFALEGQYDGAEVEMDYVNMRPRMHNMVMNIDKTAIMGSDFDVIGSGHLAFSKDDPLPFGLMEMEIVNPNNLINNKIVPTSIKSFLETALRKASGTNKEFPERITIPLKREKHGAFYIGTLTFEQITAAVVTDFLESTVSREGRAADVATELPKLPEGAPGLNETSATPQAPIKPSDAPKEK